MAGPIQGAVSTAVSTASGIAVAGKKLYEDEKKLRQKLQHDNVNGSNSGGETDTRTDEQIAIDVVRTILGG